MSLYTVIILIAILIAVFYNLKSSRVIRLRPLLLPFGCITFILLLIIFSHTAVESASKGINLWLNVVFPSLFPFFVASEILNRTGFIKSVGILLEPIMRPLFNVPGCGSFALAMGVTSGYPVGAKLTASMREEKLLTKTEAERLLSFTNNSGPLFIIGAVAVGMFNNPKIGFILLFCHILACLTVGILFSFYGKRKEHTKDICVNKIFGNFKRELANIKSVNIGEVLGDSIRNSINTMLAIGGFIILFSVIINLLLVTGVISHVSNFLEVFLCLTGISEDLIAPVLSGFFEITTGINMVSKIEGISFVQQLAAVSLILGWAGLSVHFQVYSIIAKTDISIKPYLFGKLLQGIFAGIYISLFMHLSLLIGVKSQSVFGYLNYNPSWTWFNYLTNSIKNISASLIILIIMGIISLALKRYKRNAT
jgi:sporulation integral membrane protein YlbJ